MRRLYLRDDLKAAIETGALATASIAPAGIVDALSALDGAVLRHTARRRTLRAVIAGNPYFAKAHDGVGWKEIAKNLMVLKRPVLGARDEFEACRRLAERGVAAPTVAAFGEYGTNPARRRSVILCDALEGFVSLEDVGNAWTKGSPPPGFKQRLVKAVGRLTAEMHAAGVNHRDYYACHLLADQGALDRGDPGLAVIDLHRAQVRVAAPRRWRRRDLAALLYSVSTMPLTSRDRLRFVAAYTGNRPAAELRRRRRFWSSVERRAERLRAKAARKGVAMPGGWARESGEIATVSRLADLGRTPPLPLRFDADFGDGPVRVVCTGLFRAQPGRRLVLRAELDGREVVLKAFFGRRGSRDFERERVGLATLAATAVATPRVLGTGRGGGARLLAVEYLADAAAPSAVDAEALVEALAHLHAAGVRQRDLHVDNFLVRGERVVAIDGGGVRRGRAVSAGQGWADVARLLAHFPDPGTSALKRQARRYAETRGGGVSLDEECLAVLVDRARRRRVAKWIEKTVRDCSAFAVSRDADRFVAVGRDDGDPALHAVLADPERAMAAGTPVKRGNTATVVRYGDLVIKRYNVKNRLHGWRQKLRASRARRAWKAGHGLCFAGIPTARPRALVEMRRPRVGAAASYLVLDHVEGTPLADAVARRGFDTDLQVGIAALLRAFRAVHLNHGDMKASNFVVKGSEVYVLDLDAARFESGARRFARFHARDRDRFLANWDDGDARLGAVLAEANSEPSGSPATSGAVG